MSEHIVFIVADPGCGEGVFPLARVGHVWLVESPVNELARTRFYREAMWTGDVQNPMGSGISSYAAGAGASAEDRVLNILETVDDHHGPYEPDGAWTQIVVMGATLTPALREAFEEIGATAFSVTPGGFQCHRPDPPGR
ncbi:MAG TPA: hypothetical protein VND21_03455 [Planctomycetota bacterium]|nr:hypothetical protein [Planctomycetota bacterium]